MEKDLMIPDGGSREVAWCCNHLHGLQSKTSESWAKPRKLSCFQGGKLVTIFFWMYIMMPRTDDLSVPKSGG